METVSLVDQEQEEKKVPHSDYFPFMSYSLAFYLLPLKHFHAETDIVNVVPSTFLTESHLEK